MYTSTSAPLPPNSQAPLSQEDAARYTRNMARLALSIDKARTDWRCSWQAALSSQAFPVQIPGLLPVVSVTVPGRDPATIAQEQSDAAEHTANALAMPNLTDEEREAIASAPRLLSTPQPCIPLKEDHCPPKTAVPPWGNETIAYPPAACPSISATIAEKPFTILLLVLGGLVAIDWLTD